MALRRGVEELCGVEAEDFGGVKAEVDDVDRVGYGRGCRARGTDGEPEDVDVRALSGPRDARWTEQGQGSSGSCGMRAG